MLRILLIAPTCDRHDVGEAWVAYQWAHRLGQRHDVTLLTYNKRGKKPASQQLPSVKVIEWTELPFVARWERFNSLLKPSYFSFYVQARRWILGALSRGENYDLAFQPVPVGLRYPSPAAACGIPLIIGPVGGGLSEPAGFSAQESSDPWYVKLRTLDQVRMRHDPLLRRTYENAAVVLVIAPYVTEQIDVSVKRFEVMPETGLEYLPDMPSRNYQSRRRRLLYVGRVIRTKGVRYLVDALQLVDDTDVTLDVVGDGPDLQHCRIRAQELGLGSRVAFHGWQSKSRVADFYKAADIFAFPSYREPGGNAPWEAMSYGLPMIICDRGGPAAAASDDEAIKLPISTELNLVEDLARVIGELSDDPQRLIQMSAAARIRAQKRGMWNARVSEFETVAATVVTQPAE